MEIKFCAIHHAGGNFYNPRASSIDMTAEQVNSAHKNVPDWIGYSAHLSSLGFYGGYNIFIDKTGKWTQFRKLGEETLAQKKYNLNTFSICLAGNNLVEPHTEAQKQTLKTILKAATATDVFPALWKLGIKIKDGTQLKMSMFKIYPHSAFQRTECNSLPEDWGRNLLFDEYSIPTRNILKFIQSFFFKNPQTAIGASPSDFSCSGFIN